MTLICMKMKLHAALILIWKVLHLDLFWNRGTSELGMAYSDKCSLKKQGGGGGRWEEIAPNKWHNIDNSKKFPAFHARYALQVVPFGKLPSRKKESPITRMKELKSAGVFLRNRTDIHYRKYLTGSFKSLYSCFENPSLFSTPVTHTLFKVTVGTCWRMKQKKNRYCCRRGRGNGHWVYINNGDVALWLELPTNNRSWILSELPKLESRNNLFLIYVPTFCKLTLFYNFLTNSIHHR